MNKLKWILITLLLFILLNAIIVFLWPIKVNLGLNNSKHYSEEFLKSLDLSQKDGTKLYLETWQRGRLYEYDEYTGIKESESKNAEFVNITDEDGRFIERNPNTCTKNIFFYGGELVFGYDVTDNELDEIIRNTADTAYHPSCTNKMGTDSMSVVDEETKVYGVENLRVIDSSIMPDILSGNLNAGTIMIAEKAADIILKREEAPIDADYYS